MANSIASAMAKRWLSVRRYTMKGQSIQPTRRTPPACRRMVLRVLSRSAARA